LKWGRPEKSADKGHEKTFKEINAINEFNEINAVYEFYALRFRGVVVVTRESLKAKN
jgi:hypothetical protein